jgi:carboxymethylenebutenolidase
MPESRTETFRAHDGGEFTGYLALPEAGSGPGMVVLQEIFGVNGYIRDAADRLAGLGYVALAPDLYWRIEPGVELDEREEGALERAFGYMQRLDFAKAADDAVAALEHLRGLPEVRGGAGVLGFCLGGGLSYMVAAADGPDTCVSYYGSAVPDALGMAGDVRCPILFHFGGADSYIPDEKRQAVQTAFRGRDAEFHVHPGAGHAFDNWNADMFHHPEAARNAWAQTVDFLSRTLPT